MNTNFNDWKYTRTYKNTVNLIKALDKLNLLGANPLIVGVPNTDRVTALFQYSSLERKNIEFLAVAHLGFKVV